MEVTTPDCMIERVCLCGHGIFSVRRLGTRHEWSGILTDGKQDWHGTTLAVNFFPLLLILRGWHSTQSRLFTSSEGLLAKGVMAHIEVDI